MKLIMTYYKKMIITYKKAFCDVICDYGGSDREQPFDSVWNAFLVDSISQANSLGQKELLFLLAAFAAFLLCMGFNTWMEIRWYLLLDKFRRSLYERLDTQDGGSTCGRFLIRC